MEKVKKKHVFNQEKSKKKEKNERKHSNDHEKK